MHRELAWVLGVVSLAACGGDGGKSSFDAAQVEAGAVGQEAAAQVSPYCTEKVALSSVTDLSGIWVVRVIGAQIVNAPILGEIHNQNVFYLLVTISQNGAAVAVNGHYCDRAQIGQPGAVSSVVIPDAWAHTETAVSRAGSFSLDTGGHRVLSLPAVTEIIGAVLASPSDPLPTQPDGPGVIDEDNDGHPGITVRLSGLTGGSLYAVQRQITAIEAIAVARDRLEGTLAFASEQVVLASDQALLVSLFSQSETTPDPVRCNSGVVMVRIRDVPMADGGAVDVGGPDHGALDGGVGSMGAFDCAWVRANEATLFQ